MADQSPLASPVGRLSQRADLREWVDQLAQGQGRAVLIEGEAGIGKSALVRTVMPEATAAGCQVFWAACDELSQAFPLLPLLQVLDCDPDGGRGRIAVSSLLRAEMPRGQPGRRHRRRGRATPRARRRPVREGAGHAGDRRPPVGRSGERDDHRPARAGRPLRPAAARRHQPAGAQARRHRGVAARPVSRLGRLAHQLHHRRDGRAGRHARRRRTRPPVAQARGGRRRQPALPHRAGRRTRPRWRARRRWRDRRGHQRPHARLAVRGDHRPARVPQPGRPRGGPRRRAARSRLRRLRARRRLRPAVDRPAADPRRGHPGRRRAGERRRADLPASADPVLALRGHAGGGALGLAPRRRACPHGRRRGARAGRPPAAAHRGAGRRRRRGRPVGLRVAGRGRRRSSSARRRTSRSRCCAGR